LSIGPEPNISSPIHPTALVDPNAELGTNVTIGPYSIIESDVIIGNDTHVGNHVTICSGTTIGESCSIFHNCSIGEIPQDLKFTGENTVTRIGNNTTVREYVTINRGTRALGETIVGSHCLLMAYVHVAHDCILGNHVILSNMATMGGHVTIGDWASLGGGVLIHQFCRIGEHVFVGAGFKVTQDVPPFILAANEPLSFGGINRVGLKRRGFSSEDKKIIKEIYTIYFRSGSNRNQALEKIESELEPSNYRDRILEFIRSSERGII